MFKRNAKGGDRREGGGQTVGWIKGRADKREKGEGVKRRDHSQKTATEGKLQYFLFGALSHVVCPPLLRSTNWSDVFGFLLRMQDCFTRSYVGLRVLECRKEYNGISIVNFPSVYVLEVI